MSLQTLRELPYLTIHFDFANEWVYADWQGALDYESIMAGAEAVLACVAAESCKKLLNDNTRVTSIALGISDLAQMNVMPRLYSAGIEYVAWVYPPDEYSRQAVEGSVSQAVRPVALSFEMLETAVSWLQHM